MNDFLSLLKTCRTRGTCIGCEYEGENVCNDVEIFYENVIEKIERLTAEVERLQKYENMIKNLDADTFERLSKLMVIVEQFKNDVTALI
jgi:hypothetical protein